MNFVKLKTDLEISDYSVHELIVSFGLDVDGVFKGIKYSVVGLPIRDKILSLIPLTQVSLRTLIVTYQRL